MDDPVTVLAVDDQSVNLRLLDAVLTPARASRYQRILGR